MRKTLACTDAPAKEHTGAAKLQVGALAPYEDTKNLVMVDLAYSLMFLSVVPHRRN